MITFQCPHCGNPLHADDAFAGREGWCRVCKKLVSVPLPDGTTFEDLPSRERYRRLNALFEYAAGRADEYRALFQREQRRTREYEAEVSELHGMSARLDEIEERMRNIEALAAETLEEAEPDADAMEHVSELARRIALLTADQERERQERVKLAETMNETRLHAESLHTAASEAHDNAREAYDSVLDRFQELSDQVKQLAETPAGHERLRDEVAAFREQLSALAGTLEATRECVEGIRAAVTETRAETRDLRDGLEQARTETGRALAEPVARIDGLASQMETLRAEMEALRPLAEKLQKWTQATGAGVSERAETGLEVRAENRAGALARAVRADAVEQQAMLDSFLRFMGEWREEGPRRAQ